MSKINDAVIDILRGTKNVGSEIYDVTKEGISKAIDFAQEQVPLVIEEFLKWKFFEAIFEITVALVIPILVISCALLIIRKIKKNYNEDKQNNISPFVFINITYVAILLFSAGWLRTHDVVKPVKNAIQIKVAPRIYLIEHVSEKIEELKNK